jgi:hypothetical protein
VDSHLHGSARLVEPVRPSMPSIFDPEVEANVRHRAGRLTPITAARWGSMQPAQMLCHLVDAFRVPLGESQSPLKWTPFRFFALRWLFVHLLPWPQGKLPTMAAFQQTKPREWEADRRSWNAALTRFVSNGRQEKPDWRPHPAFGVLPTWEWGRLLYRHIDHHFRQFGV